MFHESLFWAVIAPSQTISNIDVLADNFIWITTS